MYCPKCALEASTEQKFCRSCGFGLQQVSQMIESRDEKLSVKKKVILDAVGSALIIIALVIGGIASEIDDLPDVARSIMESVAWFLAMGGVGLLCYLAGLEKGLKSHRQVETKTLETSEPIGELPPQPYAESMPSVTERTTEFMEQKPSRSDTR